ncbi:PQQ-dependent sugar dehydrogenase [Halapricum sp. CBA1109]|uniref:PQQ-dependent sugar dehydrogenase n=1 Tax=Halapricum sp. CBA1109 TaxID=2668068 RepID=UPI00351B9B70
MPTLSNRLLVGGLFSQQLLVATVTPEGDPLPPADGGTRYDHDWTDDSYTVTTHTAFENELGRIRHVEQGPSGEVYVVTSNRDGRAKEGFPREVDDVLVRLTQS